MFKLLPLVQILAIKEYLIDFKKSVSQKTNKEIVSSFCCSCLMTQAKRKQMRYSSPNAQLFLLETPSSRADCKWSKTGGKVEERPAGDEKCNHRAEGCLYRVTSSVKHDAAKHTRLEEEEEKVEVEEKRCD